MSAGDARPNDGVWSGSRAVLPIIARRQGRRHRSDRQGRGREARAMATIRSEPAKPPAIWGMSVYDWAYLPHRGAAPGWRMGLLIRRSTAEPDDLTCYLTHAPEQTTLAQLVRVAGTRWTVENCFEAAKG